MLGPQNPNTVYSHGRIPYKPATLWSKLDAKYARRREKQGLTFRHIAERVDDSFMQQALEDIRDRVVENRSHRLAIIASEKVRLLGEKARLLEEKARLLKEQAFRSERLLLFGGLPFPMHLD